MTRPFRHLTTILVLPLLAAPGCDGNATGPGQGQLAPAAEVEAFLPSVLDAAERVTAGLGNRSVGTAVAAELGVLQAQLVRRDAPGIRLSVGTIRTMLLSYGTTARVEDGAELSAIDLVLDGVLRLLSEPVP